MPFIVYYHVLQRGGGEIQAIFDRLVKMGNHVGVFKHNSAGHLTIWPGIQYMYHACHFISEKIHLINI